MKRLKELREQIEKKIQERDLVEIHKNVVKLLKSIFGNKSEVSLIKEFEKQLVNKGKINPRYIHTLNELMSISKRLKQKKPLDKYECKYPADLWQSFKEKWYPEWLLNR